MGWNSWYIWDDRVTDKIMRDAADAMVASGMIDHGYHVREHRRLLGGQAGAKGPILGGPPRDAQGNIMPNKRFPDMKALTDYIHGKGLKAGIYTSPGPLTCAGCAGPTSTRSKTPGSSPTGASTSSSTTGARTADIAKNPDLAAMQKPYRKMGGILKKLDRDIVFNLCQYGMGDVWKWGREAGGQSWRTAGDLGGDFEHPYAASSATASISTAATSCRSTAAPATGTIPTTCCWAI